MEVSSNAREDVTLTRELRPLWVRYSLNLRRNQTFDMFLLLLGSDQVVLPEQRDDESRDGA